MANGRQITYRYAWRAGPRLQGAPGSPEFIASYHEAVAARIRPSGNDLSSLLDA